MARARLSWRVRDRASAEDQAWLVPRRAAGGRRAVQYFLAIVRRAGLPRPDPQVELWGRRRDFIFRDARVVVEIDGRRAHDRDGAFERDALRDAEVVVNGHRPLRFTRRAVKFDAGYVEATLRVVLQPVA